MEAKQIAAIGCGNRLSSVLKNLMQWEEPVTLTAVLDKNPDYSRSCLREKGFDVSAIRYYTDETEFFRCEHPDGMMIGTNCYAHAHYAAEVLKRGYPLFLEKPVGITEDDLSLLAPYAEKNPPVVVSFPLRVTEVCRRARQLVESGVLGKLSQVQAVNNVYYGRGYYKKWYRDDSLTGGLFLQKATHDIDCILHLLGQAPTSVIGVSTKNIFTGTHPAGLRCGVCPEQHTCPESTYVLEKLCHEPAQPDTCSFAVDTGNEDSGTMLLLFADGMHAVYTQNFVVRKSAGKRMIRLIGFSATLEFEFNSGTLRLVHHDTGAVEEYRADTQSGGHFGGDSALTRAYLDLLDGKRSDCGTLADGVLSARVCLRAKQSEGRLLPL